MLSFPSTLNTGGSKIDLPMIAKRAIGSPGDLLKSAAGQVLHEAVTTGVGGLMSALTGNSFSSASPDVSRLPFDYDSKIDLRSQFGVSPEIGGIPYNIISRPQIGRISSNANKHGWFENPLVPSPEIYSLMNTYRWVYSSGSLVPSEGRGYNAIGQEQNYLYATWGGGTLSPSLMNPYYGVQKIGSTANTPLTDTNSAALSKMSKDFTDCSIAKLCQLSAAGSSELGQARYKYSDFMYCKDLGMPNNRMITLRRFAGPVGDCIMGPSAMSSGTMETPGDVGRLVGYFDTEDNKLEDILNYSFGATWKKVTAEWQQKPSQEDQRGSFLGRLMNTMSAQYRSEMLSSTAGSNNMFDWFLGKFSIRDTGWYSNNEVLYNYDKNKVYDPIDTIRTTHLYEGILEFNHEFSVTFNYTLRAYDNINPKSAMLDLLANITATTFKKGHFWGGRQQIIGPQPNYAGWKKSEYIIKQSWDKLGGFFQALKSGGIDIAGMFGNYANYFTNIAETIEKKKDDVVKGLTDFAAKVTRSGVSDLSSAVGIFSDVMKAKVQDSLGRPQIYAFNSNLNGDDVGLWHLTIGNPRNPIAVMGNLILKDAKIQHYGPLGMDDFPTGLKVTVTLEHARPRDMVAIQKMYTRGFMAIYQNMNNPEGMGDSPSVHIGGNGMYAGDTSAARIKRNLDEIR